MIVAVDVGYQDQQARAACVAFHAWTDSLPAKEIVTTLPAVPPYIPGKFYLRELPCIEAVLTELSQLPNTIVIDGYVTLAPHGRQGLGGYLYEALGGSVKVLGVAKSRFATASHAFELYRGRSRQPLWITAIGIDPADAADRIRQMHGEYRIPSLLKRADQLTRQISA